jgi:oxygen-dependent protoporphyrinogen oxidase
VHEVAADGAGVRIVHQHGELRARHAIVATPAHVAALIVGDLPEPTRAALAEIAYGPYVVAAFLTRETSDTPWDGIYALAAARRSFNLFFNMANVLRGRERAREPGGSLMVYAAATLARRLWDADDSAVIETYLGDLEACFPGLPAVVAEGVVQRWEHGVPYVRPGRHRLQSALARPLGDVFLAGDYLGTRYTDTAIATGRAAATAVRGRL